MVKISWYFGEPPENMPVRQVYAIVFDESGRTLLKTEKVENKIIYGMIGGTPESFDKDRIATLKREFLEEVNTTLKDPVYLVGYQIIEGDKDLPPYAQIRMVAMIDKIGEKQPDPDNGKIYDRILTTPEKAVKLLGWGESAEKPIMRAFEIAKERFKLKLTSDKDVWL
ncbi:MAG: NUDIX domain-containing protein [Candidatus Caccovivens sp.]